MGAPLKIKILKIVFVLARQYSLEPNFHEPKFANGGYLRGHPKKDSGPYGEPILKIRILKIYFLLLERTKK